MVERELNSSKIDIYKFKEFMWRHSAKAKSSFAKFTQYGFEPPNYTGKYTDDEIRDAMHIVEDVYNSLKNDRRERYKWLEKMLTK